MSRIFYVMGRSASGKDTVYKKLLETFPELRPLVTYTTRPMREGEKEGEEYHFSTEQDLENIRREGRLIEQRVYQTVHGPWIYATVDDGSFRPEGPDSFLGIGTLESWNKLREYYGPEALFPIYLETDPGTLLERALKRESRRRRDTRSSAGVSSQMRLTFQRTASWQPASSAGTGMRRWTTALPRS